MAIVLISEEPLEENAALFENNAVQGEDNGSIEWTVTDLGSNNWKIVFEGTDVEGTTIETTNETMQNTGTPSPSQVFFWLADKAKGILCPTCL